MRGPRIGDLVLLNGLPKMYGLLLSYDKYLAITTIVSQVRNRDRTQWATDDIKLTNNNN